MASAVADTQNVGSSRKPGGREDGIHGLGPLPGRTVLYALLTLGGLMMIPLLWMILASLKGLPERASFSVLRPTLHPQDGTRWANTWWVLITTFIVSQVVALLVRQVFASPRTEFAEATRAGSLSEVAIFRIIALPAKPSFVTFALYNIEPARNGFTWPLMATKAESLRPLPAAFAPNGARSPFFIAISAVTTSPTFLLFASEKRYSVAGMDNEGLKG